MVEFYEKVGLSSNYSNSLLVNELMSVFLFFFLLAFIAQLFYYLYFYLRIYQKDKTVIPQFLPSVSVVIAARNEAWNLQKYLPRILNQQYADFEVIVVNDASQDESVEVLESFKRQYPHFYYTSIPYDEVYAHGKKLALLVGVKAAKKDWILFTDADCYPATENWINEFSRKMDSKAEIVLGFGGYLSRVGFLNKLIRYDAIAIAIQYFGFANAGMSYMGVGRNMAVRKSSLLKLKKYVAHSHVLSGADDLIVNELANKENVRVLTSTESFSYSNPKVNFSEWKLQKARHLSSSHFYKAGHKILLLLEPVSRFIFYTGFLLFIIYQFKIAAALYLFRLLFFTITWIKAGIKFNAKDIIFYSLIFDTFVYIIIGSISVFTRFGRQKIKWK
jgi:glycosyltransferase involved in cell wall biosynthesis